MKGMNWKLIAAFSSLGLLLGGISLTGFPRLLQYALTGAAGLLCAYWLAKKLPDKQAFHGFVIGFAAGMLTSFVQAAFFATYYANTPGLRAAFDKQAAQGVDPRQYLLSYAPVVGLLQGVALGVFAWTATTILRGPSLASEPEPPEKAVPPPAVRLNGRAKGGKKKAG